MSSSGTKWRLRGLLELGVHAAQGDLELRDEVRQRGRVEGVVLLGIAGRVDPEVHEPS